MPMPFAMFSPLTTQASTSSCSRRLREQRLDRVAARTSDDVADEEDAHG